MSTAWRAIHNLIPSFSNVLNIIFYPSFFLVSVEIMYLFAAFSN